MSLYGLPDFERPFADPLILFAHDWFTCTGQYDTEEECIFRREPLSRRDWWSRVFVYAVLGFCGFGAFLVPSLFALFAQLFSS
ncbi:hypothetical protein M011DRAFT_465392 [Sporormia fimetaria CBS 119925]|uniref:Uncharacterized protein n=1 Tax=Sporormia fimetaria CBS 119925 TaxID=1340428 RepID=A0A6A6VIU4_9PLEO|nr:hypothetical protein M011DRAFT_465392 [Sporormia fimetaria CBS 119925]